MRMVCRSLFLLTLFLLQSSFSFAGGRIAADIASHDKYDAWAEDILVGVPQSSPHYFDILPTDHRQHVVHSIKDILLKIHKDGVITYSYHTKSGWYAGLGLSSMRVDTVSQHEVQPMRLLFLNAGEGKSGNGTLFIDNLMLGYEAITDAVRGKAELCVCNGVMIRWVGQWTLFQRKSWKLLWHTRGMVSSTIDLEVAVLDMIRQRLHKQAVRGKEQLKAAYKEEVILGLGGRMVIGQLSVGAEYQFSSTENLKAGVRTPLVMRQPLPKIITPASSDLRVNDLAATSAAKAVLPNDLVLELPSAAEQEFVKESGEKEPLFKKTYYTPTLPEAVEQHRMLFDITYTWDNWRLCAHYQTGASTYPDSVGIRVSYHF